MTQLGAALKTRRILKEDHGQQKKNINHQLTIISNFPSNFQQNQQQIK